MVAAPKNEKDEMVGLLAEQGYREADARELTNLMFKNKEFFVDLMMHEELEVSAHSKNNIIQGAGATFLAFVAAGLIPIAPFLLFGATDHFFLYSIAATALALFAVGSLRSLVTKSPWFFSGAEMLAVGGIAALIAYMVGAFLKSIVGVV